MPVELDSRNAPTRILMYASFWHGSNKSSILRKQFSKSTRLHSSESLLRRADSSPTSARRRMEDEDKEDWATKVTTNDETSNNLNRRQASMHSLHGTRVGNFLKQKDEKDAE